jgi:WD40 repeat protein
MAQASADEEAVGKRYDAFISYSHRADAALARALKDALHRFAKPWYRLRGLRVFLDDANLAVSPGLWSAIALALGDAGYFLLLASPAAAQSPWVQREIEHWLAVSTRERLFIILTEGEITWSGEGQDFDWATTTALPPALAKVFREAPHWIDLRWARAKEPTLSDRRFVDAIADLAAPLHNVDRDAIEGTDLRQHRRTLLVAWSAALALGLFAVVAGVAAVVAAKERDTAVQQAEISRQRLLRQDVSNGTRLLEAGDHSAALLWYAEAARLADGHPAETALARARLGMVWRHQPRLANLWFAGGPLTALGVSDDGERAVAFLKNGSARLYDLRSGGKDGLVLQRPGARVLDVRATGERVLVLTAETGSVARVWDARTGAELLVVRHGGQVNDGGFTPDGKQVVTAAQDGTIQVSGLSPPRQAITLEQQPPADFVRMGREGRLVVTASGDRTVWAWNVGSRSAVKISLPDLPEIFTLDAAERQILTVGGGQALLSSTTTGQRISSLGDFEGVHNAAVSPDGGRVALSTDNAWLIIWDVHGKAEETSVQLDGTAIAVEFSPDGKRVATGATDQTARVWDVERGTRVLPILWHEDTVDHTVFTPDGKRLVTATVPGVVRSWDLEPNPAIRLQHEADGEVRRVSFSAGGDRVLTATRGEARVWTMDHEGRPGDRPVILNPGSQLHHAAFSPDGQRVVTCAEDGVARLWDARTGRAERDLSHRRRVNDAAFSADGRGLATASGSEVAIWEAKTGARRSVMEAAEDTSPVTQVQFGPGPDQVLARSFSGGLRVWSLRDRTEVMPLRRSDVELVAVAPDGNHLAVAGATSVEVVQATTGATVVTIPGHRYRLRQVSFSADSARLLVADEGGTARVFGAATGAPVAPPMRHRGAVRDAAFGPGDLQIATVSDDRNLRLWDARTAEPLSPPLAHREAPGVLAFSPDGRHVLTASHESAAYLWDSTPADRPLEELVQAAERLAARRIDDSGALVPLGDKAFRPR